MSNIWLQTHDILVLGESGTPVRNAFLHYTGGCGELDNGIPEHANSPYDRISGSGYCTEIIGYRIDSEWTVQVR